MEFLKRNLIKSKIMEVVNAMIEEAQREYDDNLKEIVDYHEAETKRREEQHKEAKSKLVQEHVDKVLRKLRA